MKKIHYLIILAGLSLVALTAFSANAEPDYIGSETCGMCHSEKYAEWKPSQHTGKLLSVEEAQARGVHDPPAGYTWDDILYVIGSKWKSRYVNLDGYIITDSDGEPGSNQWNYATEEWVNYHGGEVKPYDCGECHTTGYVEEGNQDGVEGLIGTWAERNIGCEACHGPGSEHIGGPSSNPMQVDVGAELCGTCHVRTSGGSIPTYEWNNPDSLSYEHGEKPQKHHQQYYDYNRTGHAEDLEPFLRDYCLKCKSTDNIYNTPLMDKAAKEVTTENAYNGVTCVACHEPHNLDLWITRPDDDHYPQKYELGAEADYNSVCIQCHVGGGIPEEKDKDVWHHTQGENFIGSIHYESGVTCVDCHMGLSAKSAVPYDIRNHTLSTKPLDTYVYSCGQAVGCHGLQDDEWVETVIDDIQTSVTSALGLAEEAINLANSTINVAIADEVSDSTISDAQGLLLKAQSHMSFIEGDGSHGFHNPIGALEYLQKSVNYAAEAEAAAYEGIADESKSNAAAIETIAKSLEDDVSDLEAEIATLKADITDLEAALAAAEEEGGIVIPGFPPVSIVFGMLVAAVAVYVISKKQTPSLF